MPLRNPQLQDRIDILRPAITKDASCGDVPGTPTTLYGNVRALPWPKRMGEKDTSFARPDWNEEIEWILDVAVDVQPGDYVRFVDEFGNTYLLEIQRSNNQSNAWVTSERCWTLKTVGRKA